MRTLLASDPTLSVIPTVTALTVRRLRHKPGKGGDASAPKPKHPVVRFVLAAWNDGDFSEAYQHVAPEVEIYTNGEHLSAEHGGAALTRETIESWRVLAPDLRMELLQEIREKHQIAIEFRVTGTQTNDVPASPGNGDVIDVVGTAFLTLDGARITEVHTVFDALTLAIQTGSVRAPASQQERRQEEA